MPKLFGKRFLIIPFVVFIVIAIFYWLPKPFPPPPPPPPPPRWRTGQFFLNFLENGAILKVEVGHSLQKALRANKRSIAKRKEDRYNYKRD